MAPKRMPMVGWFDPGQLVATAIRVVVSTLFGEFADKREAFAAANPISDTGIDASYDYGADYPEGDFWFDYVADTGDGWNPTYAVARLLARERLAVSTGRADTGAELGLPRGTVLVMGGDEVYPTPTREEYENRLLYPFEEAWKAECGSGTPERRPDLFAVPGNHDWYDGLRSFFQLFCRRTIAAPGQAQVGRAGKVILGRQTHQTRSYFALKLPCGWWLWAFDSQLEGYVDQPQVDFFQFVAEHWMEPNSKLILCTGTPDWEYVRPDSPETYDTLSYLARLASDVVQRGHQVKLLVSGDSHHYARFEENGVNHITCGGGGAFLHCTHHLPKEPIKFASAFPPPGVRYDPADSPYDREFTLARKVGTQDEALYPDRSTSKWLTGGNVLFAFKNWKLTGLLAGSYLFFTWLLDFNSRLSSNTHLVGALAKGSLTEAACAYWRLVFYSPLSILLCGLMLVAYRYFADVKRGWLRNSVGAIHAAIHAVAVTLVTCAVIQAVAPAVAPGLGRDALSLAAAAVASALASSTVIGLYLGACVLFFGIHWGHFSSLAIEGYKCFLRLHIDKEGALSIYPIGLTKVPRTRGRPWRRKDAPPQPALSPHLIEGPIVIR
jgi:hypothetical protein